MNLQAEQQSAGYDLPVIDLSRIARFQSVSAFMLLALAIFGFPLAALLEALAGTGSQSVTIPYRIFVIGVAIAVTASLAFSKIRGRFDPWLSLFLLLYSLRLVYDWQTNYIAGNIFALQFFAGIVVIPLVAITIGNIGQSSDNLLARVIMIGGGSAVLLASLGQRLGLAYNPWELYGTTEVRLGFEALNPISLGQIAASAILASLIILANRVNDWRWRVVAIFILGLSSFLLVQAGSRGALVSIAAALIWFGVTKVRRAVVIAPLLFVALTFGLAQTEVLEKITSLQDGGVYQDKSALGRLYSQEVAIADFLEAPVIGKHHANPALEAGEYPHNLLIETAMALGIIGLLLWIIMLFKAAVSMVGGLNDTRPMLVMLFVQKFIGSMLSGALWGSDAVFILLMVILTIDRKDNFKTSLPFNAALR